MAVCIWTETIVNPLTGGYCARLVLGTLSARRARPRSPLTPRQGGFSGRIGGAFVRTSFRSPSPAVHAIPERGFLPECRQILTARVIIDVPRRSEKAGQVFYRRRSDDSPPSTGVGRGVAPVAAAERSWYAARALDAAADDDGGTRTLGVCRGLPRLRRRPL